MASYKSILVQFDACAAAQTRLEFALRIAENFHAHLTGPSRPLHGSVRCLLCNNRLSQIRRGARKAVHRIESRPRTDRRGAGGNDGKHDRIALGNIETDPGHGDPRRRREGGYEVEHQNHNEQRRQRRHDLISERFLRFELTARDDMQLDADQR